LGLSAGLFFVTAARLLLLLSGSNLGIAVPSKQSFLALVAVDLLHITDLQVVIAHLVELLQIALDGNADVDGDFDGASLHLGKLNAKLLYFVCVSPCGAAAAHDRLGDLCAGDGQDDLLIAAHHLIVVRGLYHCVGDHVGLKGEKERYVHQDTEAKLVVPSGFSVLPV